MPPEDPQRTMAADQEQIRSQIKRIRRQIIVLSGKGGVGKSTVAAHLAASLAARGLKVGLLDVDIHGPSIPQIMGLKVSPASLSTSDGARSLLNPVPAGPNLSVMSIGFLLESRDTAVIWRGPMKYNVIKQFLKDVAWGDLDFLIVDSPPGTGDEPLSVVQLLEKPTGGVVVTTPQDLALSDVRKCVTFCRQLKLPVLGVIEKMSGLVCPECGAKIDVFKRGGGESMARELGIPFLGAIPIDPRLVEASDAGLPFLKRFPETETARAFEGAIAIILSKTDSPEGSTQVR